MDEVLAEIISQISKEKHSEISREIPGFLSVRRVTKLYHFTAISNLVSIFNNGFKGRRSLELEGIPYLKSDDARDEPISDGICFSLSSPNVYMMNRKIQNGYELVLLEVGPAAEILSTKNFLSIPTNFGNSQVKSEIKSWPEKFMGGEGLSNLFLNETLRLKYKLNDSDPTDPQSEIILLEPLEATYISGIYAPPESGYASRQQVSKILQKLPHGVIINSQSSSRFLPLDWRDDRVASEFRERKWDISWQL